MTIFNFNKQADIQNWRIVDDVVMGGKSSGSFDLNDDGYGVFKGEVSLENNGGFSSVRHRFETIFTKDYSTCILKVKGDGKDYQFRLKSNSSDYFSYIQSFSTHGEWQEIEIPLEDMYPSFRGRRLNQPNFNGVQMEEITFLIANKKKEEFELLIDEIFLK